MKLAEQIIAEKDHDLHAVSYRADMAAMERAALEEELVLIKTQNTSNASIHSTPQHESTPTRVREGGGRREGGWVGAGWGIDKRERELRELRE